MKILLAEDDPTTARQLVGLLEKLGHEVVHVASGHAALRVMEAPDAPSLVILDWMMPEPSGPDVCRRLRARKTTPVAYVLMLTARDSAEDVVAGLEAGANDYLRKPFDWRELRARIAVAERAIALQDDLRARATTDELTGLLNRRGIVERLQHQLQVMVRTKMPVSVIIADIDHFKAINDSAGHAAGDLVLRDVAGSMRSAVRCYDEIGRYGGEEFLVVLPDCDAAGVLTVAERIRSAVARPALCLPNGATRSLTISSGVATALEARDTDLQVLIDLADAALYEAKAGGRNKVAVKAMPAAAAA